MQGISSEMAAPTSFLNDCLYYFSHNQHRNITVWKIPTDVKSKVRGGSTHAVEG